MKKYNVTLIETQSPNDIKEGNLRVIYKDGLIKDIQKRVNGTLKSILYKEQEKDLEKLEAIKSSVKMIEEMLKSYTTEENINKNEKDN